VLPVFFAVIIAVALAQTQGKVEIIKGGAKKKRTAVVAPADNSQKVEATGVKRPAEPAGESDAKRRELEAKAPQVDAKVQDVEAREQELARQKDDEARGSEAQKSAAEKLTRDNQAALRQAADAPGGN
jgi:hypothetical protein